MKKYTLTSLILIIMLYGYVPLYSQSIAKSSIDSGGDAVTNGNIDLVYTIGEANVQELNLNGIRVSEGFVYETYILILDTKVFLQGPLLNPILAGLMNDDLRLKNYLPTNTPYLDAVNVDANVFYKGGTTTTGPVENDIVDWVWVELRSANNPSQLINARSALIQRDGDIVDLDGLSQIQLNAAPTNYYVAIKHRNHLGAMTADTFAFTESSTPVADFKNTAFLTFGNNARVALASGDMALWAGDTNNKKHIKYSGPDNGANAIKDGILEDVINGFKYTDFASKGYLTIDLDMNGIGKFEGLDNDSEFLKNNVLSHPDNVMQMQTYTIKATIPEQ